MSFAERQQLKSSGRALLLAVRSDSACEYPVHQLHCKLWQVPLPGVSDLMTCRVLTRNYFFKVITQRFSWKCISYQSSSVKTCCIGKYDVYAPVTLYGFQVVYAYFSATFYFPMSYIGRWGHLFLYLFWMPYARTLFSVTCVWQNLLLSYIYQVFLSGIFCCSASGMFFNVRKLHVLAGCILL